VKDTHLKISEFGHDGGHDLVCFGGLHALGDHGLDVVASHSQSMAEIAPIMWLMLGFFALPMAAIVGTVMTNTRRYRSIHFGFTVVYTMLNLSHLIADLVVQPIAWYQIALMVILLAIGLLINVVSFQWMQDIPHKHLAQKMNV
jgi:hypothetical protein